MREVFESNRIADIGNIENFQLFHQMSCFRLQIYRIHLTLKNLIASPQIKQASAKLRKVFEEFDFWG